MSGLTVAPTLQQFYTMLVAYLSTVTGLAASNIVQGLPNRAAMPLPGFISFQLITRHRLRTNIDEWDETDDDPTDIDIEEGVELGMQIDCYGPQAANAALGSYDWAQMICTTLRDEYGCDLVESLLSGCDPLYADDARMIPLVDGEEQYEERWSIDARFQLNPVTTAPQQYADALELTLVNVQEQFPA